MRMSRLVGLALLLTLCVVPLARPVAAGPRDQPPPQSGWTHSPGYSPDDTPARHGRPLSGAEIDFGSPTIADIDGNAGNGKEVVVGGREGRVYALRKDGSTLWQRDVPNAGCDAPFIYSKPTVGRIFGNSVTYVVVGYGSRNLNGCDGGVVVYRGTDGAVAWNFSLKDYHSQVIGDSEAGYGVISSVAMADTDRDGQMELAFGGLDRNIYLLNANGTVRWYYHAADTVWSTPLFMNVDGDAALEVVAGSDIYPNPGLQPPTQAGGYLYAFDTAPRNPPGIPFRSGYLWQTYFDQVIYSSPLAAELLSTNAGLEIAVGSGCYWPEGNPVKNGRWVKILRPSDGAVIQTLNASGCTQSSPAAGDIDEDGKNELVIIATGTGNGGDGLTRITAWDPENPNPKWQSVPYHPNSPPNDRSGHDASSDMQSPVIADLDGNGSLEVLATNFWSVHVLRGKTGQFLTCQNTQCGGQMSLFAWGTLKGTPAVGDMDNDGDLEVVIGGMHVFDDGDRTRSKAHVYAWTNFKGVLNSAEGVLGDYSAPWPEFRRTPTANGVLVEPGLTASVRDLRALSDGETRTYRIALGSTDGSSISPSASVVNDANGIASASVSGSTLIVRLDPGGLGSGNYTAAVRVTSGGLPALTVNLSLRVADDVRTAHLPGVSR